MQNYLELRVPVCFDADWFVELRRVMVEEGINVRWQPEDTFHITAVFINDDRHVAALESAFTKQLTGRMAPLLTIDVLDVFKTGGGRDYVVCLKSSVPSDDVLSLIEDLRNEATGIGADINSGFFIHITLGRIKANETTLERIKGIISRINLPAFTVALTNARYRYYRGKVIRELKIES